MDTNNKTVYFADTNNHCIQMFDLQTKVKSTLGGICGRHGDRVGGVKVMLLNGPMSVAFYQRN